MHMHHVLLSGKVGPRAAAFEVPKHFYSLSYTRQDSVASWDVPGRTYEGCVLHAWKTKRVQKRYRNNHAHRTPHAMRILSQSEVEKKVVSLPSPRRTQTIAQAPLLPPGRLMIASMPMSTLDSLWPFIYGLLPWLLPPCAGYPCPALPDELALEE